MAMRAIFDEGEPAPIVMEGGEDSVINLTDKSWNLISVSEIEEEFEEEDLPQGSAPHVAGELNHYSMMFGRLRLAILVIVLTFIAYLLLRVMISIRSCWKKRVHTVELTNSIEGPPSLWSPRPPTPPSAPTPLPPYAEEKVSPMLSPKAAALIQALNLNHELGVVAQNRAMGAPGAQVRRTATLAGILDSVPNRVQPVQPSPRHMPSME